ncbi:MAG: hypothetical protein K6G54_09095 [Oscillospiraceae bacterium]|nr:hypothetical protein [Oscillospiraceae bacterium]
MPRKSIYDVAALAVAVWLFAMMLGIGAQMLSVPPEAKAEANVLSEQDAERARAAAKLAQMTREERDTLRDRDGVVWGIQIDWASLYPAQESAPTAPTGLARLGERLDALRAVTAPYEARVAELEKFVDDYATDHAPGYQQMVEFANRYDTVIGWNIVDMSSYNPVVMAEDNYFITCVARQDQSARAAEIVALDEYCRAHGMQHLYVTTPNDACRDDAGIVDVIDFFNQNADRLQHALRDAGVDTMDLRDALHADGLNHHACFFQTDHHWLPETGCWAAGKIAQRLNDAYGFHIDTSVFAPEYWRADVYHDWFLGSQGKKVTLSRATPEDFRLLYPKFQTEFHIEIPTLDLDKSGSFSVFYRYNALRTLDYYKESPYSSYLYGDRALTRIHNLRAHDGKRVLMLGHSFDNCVIPFLATGIEYIDSIDLREFTGDLYTYLENNHYDLVIELYTE